MDLLLKKFANIEINHSNCIEKEDQEFVKNNNRYMNVCFDIIERCSVE